jgi:hypothetical protein
MIQPAGGQMTPLPTKTDSEGADAIVAHAGQAILDAVVDLELEVGATRTVESAARLTRLIRLLQEQLMCLNNLAEAQLERRRRQRNRIVMMLPTLDITRRACQTPPHRVGETRDSQRKGHDWRVLRLRN